MHGINSKEQKLVNSKHAIHKGSAGGSQFIGNGPQQVTNAQM